MKSDIIFSSVDNKQAVYNDLNDRIWEYAETAFTEFKSMDALCEALEAEGFAVEKGVAAVPTAFTGKWGSGSPVIGFLGEYDALSGINQKSACNVKEPTSPEMAGKPGHGCGHNCLGVASLAAAVALKDYLTATGKAGTVIYYGCPGEEGGSGKAFMARGDVFKGLDAALTWHNSGANGISTGSSLANYQVLYKFKGIASHAAAVPHLGRSALDAVGLMNAGVQYLREHIIDAARIHYAIIDTGGYSPNVVQPTASVLYLIRAPKVDQVGELFERVTAIAEGAAQMTETKLEIDFIKACSHTQPNTTLEKVIYANMEAYPVPAYTEEEYALASRMIESYENPEPAWASVLPHYPADKQAEVKALFEKAGSINGFLLPYNHHEIAEPGSTDVGDVSLNCPTAQCLVVTYSSGCPGHSWQQVAQNNTSIAHKGVAYAAKVLAGAAADLVEQPALLTEAKAEFDKRMDGKTYKCPIPEGVMPRALGAKM